MKMTTGLFVLFASKTNLVIFCHYAYFMIVTKIKIVKHYVNENLFPALTFEISSSLVSELKERFDQEIV